MAQIFRRMFDLLVPVEMKCIHCGNRVTRKMRSTQRPFWQSPKLHQQLCSTCLDAIPWIMQIQCPHCGRTVPCSDCARWELEGSKHHPFQCNRSAVELNETMKAWLSEFKYKGDDRYSVILGAMLLPAFYMLCIQNLQINGNSAEYQYSSKLLNKTVKRGQLWDIVTSIPISKQRGQGRGFNQAEQLALQLCDSFQLPYAPLLQRVEQSGHMSHKNKQERKQFVDQLYQPYPTIYYKQLYTKLQLAKRTEVLKILIVDDVYTTGSTVRACAGIIQAAFKQRVQIYSLTWARS